MVKKYFTLLLVCIFLSSHFSFASERQLELNELALPSETKDLGKQSGSIYYSTTSKNKTLMPVHFWGEVARSGLHYIPLDSKLVKGISFAGGGTANASLEDVYVNRIENGEMTKTEFNLAEGGDIKAHDFTLKPGDTVFVSRDTWRDNRSFYVTLTTLGVTLLSSILLFRQVKKGN